MTNAAIPNKSNLFMGTTGPSVRAVAKWFRQGGWDVTKSGWTEYEAETDWAWIVIELTSSGEVLIHGSVANVESNFSRVVDLFASTVRTSRARSTIRIGARSATS